MITYKVIDYLVYLAYFIYLFLCQTQKSSNDRLNNHTNISNIVMNDGGIFE